MTNNALSAKQFLLVNLKIYITRQKMKKADKAGRPVDTLKLDLKNLERKLYRPYDTTVSRGNTAYPLGWENDPKHFSRGAID